jgi:hypothetical protein
MKVRTAISVALVALLLLGSVALAQSGRQPPLSWYVVEGGTVVGGNYRLTGLAWQVSGAASGGRYRLLGPASPSGGNQCCCTYLPCVVRNFH